MNEQQKARPDYWREQMDEATARRILGDDHFDWAVGQGAGLCLGRASGAWYANNVEMFGAYNTAARIAQEAR